MLYLHQNVIYHLHIQLITIPSEIFTSKSSWQSPWEDIVHSDNCNPVFSHSVMS